MYPMMPPAENSVIIHDPLNGNFVSGDTINLDQLFVDRDSEIKIFEEYQAGGESLGEKKLDEFIRRKRRCVFR